MTSANKQSIRFEFATATRIIFGPGVTGEVAPLAASMVLPSERRLILVTGRNSGRVQPVRDALAGVGFHCTLFSIDREPTMDMIQRGMQYAREESCRLVVGCGGGSAIDAGKAIAALINQPGDLFDYLEVIGKGEPLTEPPLPYIAIPTTAGTGAEVTRNAVLMSPVHKVKVSLRSLQMLPRLAVVDPQLTYGLPPAITASTGLDALTQLLEAYVSVRANPITDAMCREGIQRAARSIRAVYEGAVAGIENFLARQDMALASMLGGLVLANANLGVVHGFAGPLGGMFPAPHGALCAALLPHGMAVNIDALQRTQPENEILKRYDEVARLLTGSSNASATDGIAWVQELCNGFNIPSLAQYGLTGEDSAIVVKKAAAASSMKGNPITLSHDDLLEILQRAL